MPDLYIGKVFNAQDKSLAEPFQLKSSDLTTHGIVIGMTGSGKTGLSVDIIEELLKARIPVIVIDPKGDMGNLALAFDRLAPDQFQPWVDRDEAARTGKTMEDVARAASETWTKGLGEWGINPPDVAAYAANHRVRIFTPGASAGISLNLIDSLAAPGEDFDQNEEELRDEIDGIVQALLGFVKIDSDPVSSREYILLFSLIENAWRQNQDLDLESLIGQVGNPPIQKVGALPMDSFYPQKERMGLMFALNNLVASPPFQAWRRGQPVDIEKWIRTEDGVPQLTIIYTAHLDDDQRIMVTALVLNKLKTWMRKQPGTSELRALFYMDEIFGYFPPTANPPTKKPLLTLLKQARAYGVGILLSTQNPVDLDYKGLGNMGFWAIGRLQTTQDQARVREGIESALADAGNIDFDTMIGGVQKRVFLIHDIHRKAPQLVQSRFAMSYLRGPITRDELRLLGPQVTGHEETAARAASTSQASAPGSVRGSAGASVSPPVSNPAPASAPMLPPPLKARFANRHGGTVAEAYVFAKAAVRYRAGGVTGAEQTRELAWKAPAGIMAGELLESIPIVLRDSELEDSGPAGLRFSDLPGFIQNDGARAIERVLKDRLDDQLQAEMLYDPVTKSFAAPDEEARDFALRLGHAASANPKRQAIQVKLDKARSDLAIKEREASGRKLEKWASVGTAIFGNLGVFSGRSKRIKTTGLGSVLSKSRMEGTASERRDAIEARIRELEAELSEVETVDPARFERRVVKPARADVSLIRYDVVWVY